LGFGIGRLQFGEQFTFNAIAGFCLLLRLLHFNFRFHPLSSMANGSEQPGSLDLSLNEKILRALLQSLISHQFVFASGQHNQRDARRGGARPPHRFESLCVRQPQVEQDDIHGVGREATLCFPHISDFSQDELKRRLLQDLSEQTNIQ